MLVNGLSRVSCRSQVRYANNSWSDPGHTSEDPFVTMNMVPEGLYQTWPFHPGSTCRGNSVKKNVHSSFTEQRKSLYLGIVWPGA